MPRGRVFLEKDAPVTALSTLTYDGRKLRVVGDPLVFSDGKRAHHLEVKAEALEGRNSFRLDWRDGSPHDHHQLALSLC